ncbi:hypothetical protein EVAR_9727_1 [Eumeta japonica]|uniref:Uncharacterized protein n=1 Tax=Eumeta variegata TaxID=151549 RepID=A0A4C1U6G0_EUMVA|nr:hypothetical protein EVAR_9727_1 [Eumeta japonica]
MKLFRFLVVLVACVALLAQGCASRPRRPLRRSICYFKTLCYYAPRAGRAAPAPAPAPAPSPCGDDSRSYMPEVRARKSRDRPASAARKSMNIRGMSPSKMPYDIRLWEQPK